MGEALWEVPEEIARRGVDLLGEEAEVAGAGEHLLHQGFRLVEAPLARERLHEPERARDECSLLARKPVLGEVAVDERAVRELAADRVDRPREPARARIVV